MGYAAAPRVAFIVYGIQTFFTAIIIIIIIHNSQSVLFWQDCARDLSSFCKNTYSRIGAGRGDLGS